MSKRNFSPFNKGYSGKKDLDAPESVNIESGVINSSFNKIKIGLKDKNQKNICETEGNSQEFEIIGSIYE